MNMKLSDITTIQEVALKYNISVATLKTRLTLPNFGLIENIDYRRMGKGQGVLLSPKGEKKITRNRWDIKKGI